MSTGGEMLYRLETDLPIFKCQKCGFDRPYIQVHGTKGNLNRKYYNPYFLIICLSCQNRWTLKIGKKRKRPKSNDAKVNHDN